MYNKKEIKKMLIDYQEEELESILNKIENIQKTKKLTLLEKLEGIAELCEDFYSIKDDMLIESDVDKYIDEKYIESSIIKARECAESEDVPNYMIDSYIKGFVIGYLGEHIKIYKRLEKMDKETFDKLIAEKKM